MAENERHRLQLDFHPEAYQKLLDIRKKAGARTNAEVVRNALRLYDWFLSQKKLDCRILLAKGDAVTEVEILFG